MCEFSVVCYWKKSFLKAKWGPESHQKIGKTEISKKLMVLYD